MRGSITLVILAVSLMAQVAATWMAFRQMNNVIGRYQVAWGCVAVALALMMGRRFVPLWRMMETRGPGDLADAVTGMCVSLLMAAGVYGVRRLFTDLKALAQTDALTGLANRRDVLQRAEHEIERAARTKRPLAFLMIDIDHFKRVNDAYGHSAGDVVLRAVADIARAEFRRIDTIGRIGGEEFLAVLPDSGQENASSAAERIRRAVAEHEFLAGDRRIGITISIGVMVPDTATSSVTVEDVLKATDKALYAAKNRGRNCVVMLNQPAA